MKAKRTDGKLECEPIYVSSVIQCYVERGTIEMHVAALVWVISDIE